MFFNPLGDNAVRREIDPLKDLDEGLRYSIYLHRDSTGVTRCRVPWKNWAEV